MSKKMVTVIAMTIISPSPNCSPMQKENVWLGGMGYICCFITWRKKMEFRFGFLFFLFHQLSTFYYNFTLLLLHKFYLCMKYDLLTTKLEKQLNYK